MGIFNERIWLVILAPKDQAYRYASELYPPRVSV